MSGLDMSGPAPEPAVRIDVDEADFPAGGRRRRAARGAVINAGFFVALGTLGLLKAVIVARFLTASEFGVWSILYLAVALIAGVKGVIVSEKFIQQDEPDQERAFQKAFTLELLSAAVMAAGMLVLVPLLTLAYATPQLLAPGLALALVLPGMALQAPIWVYYRRMDFVRQRLFLSVDPLVGFVVTIVLAAVGAGYWSLVVGTTAGAWCGGLVAISNSPYRPAIRFDREALHSYFHFSWPLVTAVAAGLLIAQLSVFFGKLAVGLAGAGAIGLAASFSAYTDKVDSFVTEAMYPAVCRVRDRAEILFEAFAKSNRLALMWGVPFGAGLALFAADLVHFGIGEKWSDAIVLLQVFGLTAAINHIGFNWNAFYRARADTRPVAIVTVAAFVAFLASAIPLLFAYGLAGFAAGIAVTTLVSLALRFYYLAKLFPGFQIVAHSLRAISPTLPAAGIVLGIRALETGHRSSGAALVELAVYLIVAAAVTFLVERSLIREAISYFRRRPEGRLQVA